MQERAQEVSVGRHPMFLLLALLLLFVLPSPWNVIGGLASGALGIVEVVYWQRRMRRAKVQTGVENLLGATGDVTEELAPTGNVRVLGELWQARSISELSRGSRVRVVAVHGARRGCGERDVRFGGVSALVLPVPRRSGVLRMAAARAPRPSRPPSYGGRPR